ncbi:MAG: GNAT family N-acetyltransferase [Bacteroidetes bacterium]|nr:MAG: GNAT family N-acetyltransferase [Bacteroidota bacterium]
MSDLLIRDYEPTDYPAIENLWSQTGLGGAQRGDNQQTIELSLKMGGKFLVVINKSGELIATSWMTFDGRRLHLHHFGVLPYCQRQGIGKLLALQSIAFAKERNTQIKLEVHKSNKAAISLYTSLGFVSLGDYEVYIRPC